MTQPPDWWSQLTPGIHNAPPRVPAPDPVAFTWQQLQQIVSGLVNEFLRQVAVALGAIEIFGFKPYEALVEIGENIAAGVDNFNLLLTAFGLPTIGDVADLLANQANDFATFLAATGQATFAALGAALQSLIDFLTAIPANLLSGALPTNVTLSGTQLGTLLQYLNSSGQYAAAQLTGSINGALTLGGTTLSTLFTNINGSGQLLASGLTGGLNTAVTFGGTALLTFFQNINASGQLLAPGITGALNGAVTLGGTTLSTLVTNINNSGQLLASGITGALGTGLTVGGVTLGTLFTNINSSGQLVLSGATGALNTAVTIGGTALSTLSTNWNAAVTNVNSLISGVTGASTAADVATNINLAATNIAQIGTAAQNAAAGVVGSLNTAATQVQTAFSGILNGIFGAVTNFTVPAAAPVTTAQATQAVAAVTSSTVAAGAAAIALQSGGRTVIGLKSEVVSFADYANSSSLPALFSTTYSGFGSGTYGVVDGKAAWVSLVGGSRVARNQYTGSNTTTDYQVVSATFAGSNTNPELIRLTGRMNAAGTTYVEAALAPGANQAAIYTVVGGTLTPWITINDFVYNPTGTYSFECGDVNGGAPRKFRVLCNGELVPGLSYTESGTTSQLGASYRGSGWESRASERAGDYYQLPISQWAVMDQIARPGPAAAAYVSTSQTTTSTSYTDLSTAGPAVTTTIGSSGMALVTVSANLQNNTQASRSYMGFAVSGATTQAAADSYSIAIGIAAGVANMGHFAGSFLVAGLTPGSNTFTAKYRVSATTGTFADRRISVIPL